MFFGVSQTIPATPLLAHQEGAIAAKGLCKERGIQFCSGVLGGIAPLGGIARDWFANREIVGH